MKQQFNRFPPGWDEDRVRRLLAHYESQTDEESVMEDEARFDNRKTTVMNVPRMLVPLVRGLIAQHKEMSSVGSAARYRGHRAG